ncbi:patatin-like phospholipase family protein [Rhodoferax sp. WC2427]|uniref:patatin-like phospholipase family protein n=1 Tax=Rhodoferax sp. WC2427 TaxID=3234144 RepID=UPI003467CAAB
MHLPHPKYQRCMVFAGGGFRFGIYLGMYAAARDAGRAPDLLLATCGGAIAAAIIQALPDDAQRKAWLNSPQMYRFWGSLQPAPQASIVRTLAGAARRKLSRQCAPRVPDVFNDYLFEIPPQLPLPPPAARSEVTVATIGGQLLFGPADVGQPRGKRKLFAQTVFGPQRVAALVQGMASPFADPRWGDHAVAQGVQTDTTLPLDAAARMAITDFYYFPSYRHGAGHYIGGVVDLFPIELAHRLADTVMLEFKESFDQHFEIPAWRAVLGLDGNQRLRHVNAQPADVWFDTSDVAAALPVQPVQRQLQWWRNRIVLAQPIDYAAYVRAMDAQWQYGYQRGQEALQRPVPGDTAGMRNVDRYNRGEE